MEKLFDETFSPDSKGCRTIWYGYFNGDLNDDLANEFINLIHKDLKTPPEGYDIASTNWVFYNEKVSKDAIGDAVRSSLMVRHLDGTYIANFNMTDYQFVTAYDVMESFKETLVEKLNM